MADRDHELRHLWGWIFTLGCLTVIVGILAVGFSVLFTFVSLFFLASVLIADQMPLMGSPNRVRVKEYAGGHMFYSRTASQLALRADAMKMYGEH